MACSSCPSENRSVNDSPEWRHVLWIALAVNAGMFAVEVTAGVLGGSKSLQADALDFLGDAANYAVSLGVTGMMLAWRARAAMLKAITILIFGVYVLASTGWAAMHGGVPRAELMGLVGFAALIANVAVAGMLFRYRGGDANMQSVWLCSRNDAISNIAVIGAAGGVFGTGSAWPDLLVATLMAGLAIWAGMQILTQARSELASCSRRSIAAAE